MTDTIEHAVLFVCLGNICRSPTAEGVVRHLAAEIGLERSLELDSAGLIDFHAGQPPDQRAQRAAAARGIDLSGIRGRRVQSDDFYRFDLILAMDGDNLRELEAMRPSDARATLGLLMDYAPTREEREVPDPYLGSSRGFDYVIELIEDAGRGLLQHLQLDRNRA